MLERLLSERLAGPGETPPLRVIRADGARALVEVPHTWAVKARSAWTGRWTTPDGVAVEARTYRTWGTLLGAKRWLRRQGGDGQVGALKYRRRP